MQRLLVEWSGPSIEGTAVNVLHFADTPAVPDVATVRGAYGNLESILPSNVTITVPSSGDIINPATGELEGEWTTTDTPAPVVGLGGAQAAAGVGASVTWLTGGIVNGHRVRGRTFLVPLSAQVYDVDGTFVGSAVTALQAFAATMVGTTFGVWSRPVDVPAVAGSFHDAVSSRLADRVSVLKSRRY